MKGLPLVIYRRLSKTADQFRVGHVVLTFEIILHGRIILTNYTYCRNSVIFCCVQLYSPCHLAYLYCISSCTTVSSLPLIVHNRLTVVSIIRPCKTSSNVKTTWPTLNWSAVLPSHRYMPSGSPFIPVPVVPSIHSIISHSLCLSWNHLNQ